MEALPGYGEFNQLFDESVSTIWQEEPVSFLKKLSVIVFCFNRELKNLQETLNRDADSVRLRFEQKLTPSKELSKQNSSPSMIMSDSDDITMAGNSPEIKKKFIKHKESKKKRKKLKEKGTSLNLLQQSCITTPTLHSKTVDKATECSVNFFRNYDHDVSIIQGTPTATDKTSSLVLKRKKKITKCENDKENSQMDISNMVDYLNQMDEEESSLNSAMLENNSMHLLSGDLNEFLAKAQQVSDKQPVVEPVVRGKIKKQLPGWSCKECEQFYTKQGLGGDQILRLSKCSKHRGYFKPREDTVVGYWDMDIITPKTP